ncbi:hypothetical protein Q73A0000_01380 [Kaistella flava (ex Peng et al. 2021)]|uniref:Uncharacterized protein n=1 Tax=Kaistella flava (ex Peng et al. 2021) TaxID=2038776 RepID=A0A7M2Y5Z7_9FLAO|nr:hypothetical protein [Kaistella flava (ex Peng et al. 2021)]QOW09094.1 hypothetical protein Q73A0000_01380 [Kaistella flava (ex Peng et al. 2021)]
MLTTYLDVEEFKENFRDNFSGYGGPVIDFLKEYRNLYDQVQEEYNERISNAVILILEEVSMEGVHQRTDIQDALKRTYAALIPDLKFSVNQKLLETLIYCIDETPHTDRWENLHEGTVICYRECMEAICAYLDEYIEQERKENLRAVSQRNIGGNIINSQENESGSENKEIQEVGDYDDSIFYSKNASDFFYRVLDKFGELRSNGRDSNINWIFDRCRGVSKEMKETKEVIRLKSKVDFLKKFEVNHQKAFSKIGHTEKRNKIFLIELENYSIK